MKGGRTRNSTGSCGLCGRNLHRQTSSSTIFRIFAATEKRRRELTLFILSLSLPQTPFKRRNREFQPGKRRQCRLTDASSFSLLPRVHFLPFRADILGKIHLIVHLFSSEGHFDSKSKSAGFSIVLH